MERERERPVCDFAFILFLYLFPSRNSSNSQKNLEKSVNLEGAVQPGVRED